MARREKTSGKKLKIKNLVALLIVAVIAVIAVCLVLGSLGKPVDKTDDTMQIVAVEQGYGTAAIANTLKEAGLIKNTTNFRIISKLKGFDGKYKAGKYELSRSMSMKDMMKKIVAGETVTNSYTIPEGYRLQDVAALLDDHGFCSSEDFMYEVQYGEFDYDFMQYLPEGEKRLEGVLFPNTYVIDVDASAHDIIDQMLAAFDSILTDEFLESIEASEYGFYDILKVASIVEGESRVDEDRAQIASVIYNRLEINMKLQMDSTIQYLFDSQHKRVSTADTEIQNDYNTYATEGLPPTPICSPGAKSIEAAVSPADTDYLFFVVSKKLDGSHVFSEDYETFEKDKAEYQAALEQYYDEHPDENEYDY